MQTRQILTRLKRANSKGEIDALLAEAEMFLNISKATRSRHERFAAKRIKELEESK